MVSRITDLGLQHTDNSAPDDFLSSHERITRPDHIEIAETQAMGVKQVRIKTKEITDGYAREQEVMVKICSADYVDRDRLKSMRKAMSEGLLTFAEYQSSRSGASYVYVVPGHEVPKASMAYRWVQNTNEQPKTATLLKIGTDGKVTELHHWKD